METGAPVEENKPKLEKLEDEYSMSAGRDGDEEESEIISILPGPDYSELDRIDLLESGMKTCRDRLDGFGQELKVLMVEINIISEFIQEQFGVELINRVSQLRKHIHDFDEIEELTKSLSTRSGRVRRSNRQASAKWTREQERRERLARRRERLFENTEEEHDDCSDDENPELQRVRNEFGSKRGEGTEDTVDPQDVESVDDQLSDGYVYVTPEKKYRPSPKSTQQSHSTSQESGCRSRRLKPSILRQRKQQLQTQSSGLEDDNNVKPDLDRSIEDNPRPSASSGKRRNGKQRNGTGVEGPPRARGRPKKAPEEKLTPAPDKPPRQCDECGKILKGPGSLKSHMNMHADLRPYPCLEEGCGKRFRVKNKLNLHTMIHKGDKKEQCRFCGKLFYFAKDLARHERTHTGEKPNICPVCQKSFNVKQHLTLHLRTHTGERPYQCPICEKWFSQANSLRIHKKIHVKATEAAAAGLTPKKPRAATKAKRRSTSHDVVIETGDDDIFENIVTVLPISVLPAGTRLDASEILEIRQCEGSSHSHKVTYRNSNANKGASPDQENQVQVITVNSQETQLLDQEGWKLMTTHHAGVGSSLATVQFPIYGFEFQQNRLPVIASTSAVSMELQRPPHSPSNPETATDRYFQEHSKE